MIPRPQPDEYSAFAAGYVQNVPEGSDILALLGQQPDDLKTLLQAVSDEQANHQPAAGEWSIKEVVGHICDTERVFAYRALRIARGDATPLAGFDQDDYVRATTFNDRSLADLVEEFSLQRRANLLCFKPLTQAEVERRGIVRSYSTSVRGVFYVMAGHVIHHVESLKQDYKVGG